MTIASSNGGSDPELSKVIQKSVVSTPDIGTSLGPPSPAPQDYIIWVGMMADAILPWGRAPKQRDQQLRMFYPTENYLLSAITTIAGRNAAFSWKLNGPEKLVKIAQDMFLNANRGLGWESWVTKTSIDLSSQDSGGFVEIIRAGDTPSAPVINFAHLDAGRCYSTGDPETPVIYRDRLDRFHALKWYQVHHLLESPAPHENYQGPLYGLQFSAVSKVLKAAQILKSISTYQDEKLSGRNESAIHLIRGIDVKKIEDAMLQTRAMADSQGLTRYIRPAMVGSHNPDAEVGHDTIELASLPPNFDLETTMKWYISAMALAFGVDYQDFAPLPSGHLGSGKQSEVLHMKSRGKGPALWQKLMEHFLNTSGVLPEGVTFMFDEQDMEAEKDVAAMALQRAQERAARILSTEIDGEAARSLALDAGDLTQEQYDALEKRSIEAKAKADAKQPPVGAPGELTEAQGAATGAPAQGGGPSDAQGKDNAAVTAAKERVLPGRVELEAAVVDPIEEILSSVSRKLTGRIRALAQPEPMVDEKSYAPHRPRRLLRTVTAKDTAGRAMQVLEEEIA